MAFSLKSKHLIAMLCSLIGFLELAAFPSGFDQTLLIGNLQDPATMAFAPDGRLFYGERIQGNIRIIDTNGQLLTQPFLTLDVPHNGIGTPERHRSAGVRGFAFDPDYANNGYIYIFYMKQFANGIRHNRISRFQTDSNDPNAALSNSETILMELPFNDGGLGGSGLGSSGSHNGGAVLFGGDGKLYFTTGDGWQSSAGYNAGDTVQSLSTYTGKVFRINPDGTIPTDNPFYNQATGNYRAIYALGLRNPFAATLHPQTGEIFIFDVGTAWGGNKDYIYRLAAGDNYHHDTYDGIGTSKSPWVFTGSRVVSGGAWYFGGQFPAEYQGCLFVTAFTGDDIRRVLSETTPTVSVFADNEIDNDGPLYIQVGPDGSLYYLKSTYETSNGEIYKISYTGNNTVSTPIVSPTGGTFVLSTNITITTFTNGAALYYTLDGTDPTEASTLYAGPITLTNSSTLKVRGFLAGMTPSQIVTANFTIQPGTAPTINSIAETNGIVNELYQYDVDATGVPSATYSLDQAPPSMTIDSNSGVIDWIPVSTGDFDVVVRASNGVAPDATQAFTISVLDVRLADNPTDIVNGLHYSYYQGDFQALPDYRLFPAIKSGNTDGLDLSTREQDDFFMYRFYGYIEVLTDGDYTFYLNSDEGSALFIGDNLVVDNDGIHGLQETAGTIGLQAGKHRISIEYFERTGIEALELSYAGPGITKTLVPNSLYYRFQTPYGLDTRPPSAAYLNFPNIENGPIPTLLSQTGAFFDLSELTPNPGIIPYAVNSPLWSDGAEKFRWISLPTGTSIDFAASGAWNFPPGTVFIKHFELGPESRRLETRFVIVKEDLSVYGVTYRWREDNSDAELVPTAGLQETINLNYGETQTWHYPSRTDCLECHNASSGFVLGVRTGQLNRDLTYAYTGNTDNQLRTWNHLNAFLSTLDENNIDSLEKWVPVDATSEPLELRVKSYWASNCALCHNPNNPIEGADFDARFETPLSLMNIVDQVANNDLGIAGSSIIKPQDPHRSALYQRTNTNDTAIAMPPLARSVIDEAARDALLQWIVSLQPEGTADVSDYVSRWKFDSSVADAAGTANSSWRNGGSESYAPAQLDNGLVFDGADDAVDFSSYDISGDAMTIAFWFNADDFGTTDARFISKATDQAESAHYWMVSTLNSTRLRFRLKAGGTTTTLSSALNTIAAGEWIHVAAVYDGSSMKMYKDGVEVAMTSKSGTIDQAPAVPVSIGNQPASATGGMRPFDGIIDDLRIYDRALSGSEIDTVRMAGIVIDASPSVTITTPSQGASFVLPTSINFNGSGTDPEDGDISSGALWLSNRDGAIGSGANITSSTLSAGEHLIVMTVTDSFGNAQSDLLSLNVLSAFQNWAAAYALSPEDAIAFANPDQGMLNNLSEFFLGGDPTLNEDSTLLPQLFFDSQLPGTINLRFRKATNLLNYRIEWSNNLTDWFDASLVDGFSEIHAGQDTDGIDLYDAAIPFNVDEQKFLRLMIAE